MTHTLSSCKDSRFGYSVLSGVESHRFQTSAYLFRQFQVLFAIDTSANVLPWEHEAVTRRLFLERIPATSLLHLSAFKDYLLGWAEDSYQVLEDEDFLMPVDLTKGRYSPRSQSGKETDVSLWYRTDYSSLLIRRSTLHDGANRPMGYR